MFSLLPKLPGLPGPDDIRGVVRRVDTARHNGIPDGCILELDLQHAPPETAGFDPMALIAGQARPLTLREMVAAIHRAAEDDRVAGLIARVQIAAAPAGPIQELRAAIAEFTAAKPSLAWAETYPGTMSYYLASAFGEVWMQPSGTVGLVGFATNAMFLRDALAKAGIEAQFVARGEYKSAANLFTQDSYTDAHREADTALVESLQAQVRAAVAESRDIEPAAVDELADRAPLQRDDAVAGRLTWTSTYGSVVATAFDITSTDGLNEAGLAGHILWLAESTYGEPDDSRTQLGQGIWLQYFLDNFATVAEAVAWIAETDVQVVQMDDPTGGERPGLHLALDDATGDSAIIEYVDGHARVYHSRDYKVMTNSPTFDQQLELVKSFTGLGGDKPLPGGTDARDRFARASFYVDRVPMPNSQVEAVAAMLLQRYALALPAGAGPD